MRCLHVVQNRDAADAEGMPPAILAMECLLTTMVADESDWSASWHKLLRHVMDNNKLPSSLKDLSLEVPRQLNYMLEASLSNVGVKAEGTDDITEPAGPSVLSGHGVGSDTTQTTGQLDSNPRAAEGYINNVWNLCFGAATAELRVATY